MKFVAYPDLVLFSVGSSMVVFFILVIIGTCNHLLIVTIAALLWIVLAAFLLRTVCTVIEVHDDHFIISNIKKRVVPFSEVKEICETKSYSNPFQKKIFIIEEQSGKRIIIQNSSFTEWIGNNRERFHFRNNLKID